MIMKKLYEFHLLNKELKAINSKERALKENA